MHSLLPNSRVARDIPKQGSGAAPGKGNTIFPADGGIKATYIGDELLVLDEAAVIAELAKFGAEPLLYVGQPVLVSMSSKQDAPGAKIGWKHSFNTTLQVGDRGGLCFVTCYVSLNRTVPLGEQQAASSSPESSPKPGIQNLPLCSVPLSSSVEVSKWYRMALQMTRPLSAI